MRSWIYLNKVINKHPPLEEYLCSNAGVELMNIDSQITEKIVNRFTKKKIPIPAYTIALLFQLNMMTN